MVVENIWALLFFVIYYLTLAIIYYEIMFEVISFQDLFSSLQHHLWFFKYTNTSMRYTFKSGGILLQIRKSFEFYFNEFLTLISHKGTGLSQQLQLKIITL